MSELREAFREAARREFAAVPPEEELDYVFSPRFEHRMRRLIRAQAHSYWFLINTAAKRAAIVAAIILALLTTALAIKPVRQRIIQFFVDVYEEYFEIRFGEEKKDDIDPTPTSMVRYTLTELPEGYEEVAFIGMQHLLWTKWEDPNGSRIILQQEVGTQEITIDNRKQGATLIEDKTISVFYKENANGQSYTWGKDGFIFVLTTYNSSPEQDLEMIASLKIFE